MSLIVKIYRKFFPAPAIDQRLPHQKYPELLEWKKGDRICGKFFHDSYTVILNLEGVVEQGIVMRIEDETPFGALDPRRNLTEPFLHLFEGFDYLDNNFINLSLQDRQNVRRSEMLRHQIEEDFYPQLLRHSAEQIDRMYEQKLLGA